jgi:hypothetical protein
MDAIAETQPPLSSTKTTSFNTSPSFTSTSTHSSAPSSSPTIARNSPTPEETITQTRERCGNTGCNNRKDVKHGRGWRKICRGCSLESSLKAGLRGVRAKKITKKVSQAREDEVSKVTNKAIAVNKREDLVEKKEHSTESLSALQERLSKRVLNLLT